MGLGLVIYFKLGVSRDYEGSSRDKENGWVGSKGGWMEIRRG